MSNHFNLERFVAGQEIVYQRALREIQQGHKQSHWMWFVFPQIAGLGHSDITQRYAIRSHAEAKAFLAHPVLGKRLVEITQALLSVKSKTAADIFGHPDNLKLKSSMTLFHQAVGKPGSVFKQVLEKYFNDDDDATLNVLSNQA